MRVYVHIPFCESKCSYCAFASFVNPQEETKYFDALISEIASRSTGEEVESVYFGGGTPSCVAPKNLERVLEKIKQGFKLSPKAEITIELNPNSTTKQKLDFYKHIGINRLSFGVQNLNDKVLQFLGRRHTKKQALFAIKEAKKCGFENISADLLLGVKGSRPKHDAATLLRAKVKHISAYMLQIEEGTSLKKLASKGCKKIASEDESAKIYQKLAQFLQKKGLKRYEISNFAFPGYESSHNIAYWTGEKYLGFGLGAHSYDGKNERSANATNFEDYYAGKVTSERLSQTERDEEIIMLGLRCEYGFDKEKLSFDIEKLPSYKNFIKQKILFSCGNIVTLNPDYYAASNAVILQLLKD